MCMIFCAKEGVPTLSVMERAEKGNNDGAGIAWITQASVPKGEKKRNVVHWEKNLKAKEVFELMNDLKLEKYLPEFPFVIHFRSASSGGVNPELCQPFSVDKRVSVDLEGEAEEVLFHNGTYGSWDDMMKMVCWSGGAEMPPGPWNDSRSLAWLMANRGIGALALTNHGGYVNSGGRIAILRNTGSLQLLGKGWQDGEQKGVVQSGFVPTVSYSHSKSSMEISHGASHPSPRIVRPVKCSLYEESDKVILYSLKEHEEILKEIEAEQRSLSCGN